MKVKVIHTDNYHHSLIVLKEEGDLCHFINEEGGLSQLKRTKMSIDSELLAPIEEVYKLLDPLKNSGAQLEYLLKYRCALEKENMENMLNCPLVSHHKTHICFENREKNIRALMYFSLFQLGLKKCEVEIYDHHLEHLKEGQKKIVTLVLEEFGTFYLNGSTFLKYLEGAPNRKKNGKKVWCLGLDYDQLLRVPGEVPFNDYSNKIEYIKNFAQESPSHYENVVDLAAVRHIQNMFKTIKEKKAGFTVVSDGKKRKLNPV